jgi:hypothetical protein
MAAVSFALKDVVSMTLQKWENSSGLLGPLVQAQPPKFGIVAAGTGGPPFTSVDVLWEDGRLTTAIPVAALDLIGVPDAGVVGNLQGFILKTDPTTAAQAESPEYQGIAVNFYTRQNGDGTVTDPTETLCLMKLNEGTFRELLASSLTVAAGR